MDPVHELLERARHGVGQVALVEIDTADPLPVAECYPSRDAHDHGVLRHLAHDHRPGADPAAAADGEAADHLGPCPYDHIVAERGVALLALEAGDRKSTRLNSSHVEISYAVFCLKKKKNN